MGRSIHRWLRPALALPLLLACRPGLGRDARAEDERRAEEARRDRATIDRVVHAFLWDATRYGVLLDRVKTKIVLDPDLVDEDSGAPEPGLCDHKQRVVRLNRGLWLAYGETEREIVLYHELGHCELNRRHTEGRRADGGPVSLMNRNTVADAAAIAADRETYLRELFTTASRPPRTLVGGPVFPLGVNAHR